MERRYIPEMAWPEVQGYLDRGGETVILALGSTENHGHHAPLGTDTIIAEEVCRRLAPRVDALIAPVLPLGYCPHHVPYPGSISLPNELLAEVLVESGRSLHSQGFRRFLFISGHGGNKTALDLAAGRLKRSQAGVRCIHINMMAVQTGRPMRDEVEAAYGKPLSKVWEAHGGEQETAAVLAVRPELIDLSKAAPEPDMTAYLAKSRDPHVYEIEFDLKRYSPAGNWGDPRGATAEQGDIYYEKMAEALAAKVLRLL